VLAADSEQEDRAVSIRIMYAAMIMGSGRVFLLIYFAVTKRAISGANRTRLAMLRLVRPSQRP